MIRAMRLPHGPTTRGPFGRKAPYGSTFPYACRLAITVNRVGSIVDETGYQLGFCKTNIDDDALAEMSGAQRWADASVNVNYQEPWSSDAKSGASLKKIVIGKRSRKAHHPRPRGE